MLKTTHDVSACFLLQVKPLTWRGKKHLLMKRRVLRSVFLWRWKNLLWMLLVSLEHTHSCCNDRTARTAGRATPFGVSSCKRRDSWWIRSLSVTTPDSDWHVPITDTANVYSLPFVVLRTKMSYILTWCLKCTAEPSPTETLFKHLIHTVSTIRSASGEQTIHTLRLLMEIYVYYKIRRFIACHLSHFSNWSGSTKNSRHFISKSRSATCFG